MVKTSYEKKWSWKLPDVLDDILDVLNILRSCDSTFTNIFYVGSTIPIYYSMVKDWFKCFSDGTSMSVRAPQ